MAFVLFPLMTAFFVHSAISWGKDDPIFYFTAVMCIVVTIALPFRTIRRIEFGDTIVVRRYLAPSYEFDYADILDIGVTTVRTKPGKGNIFLPKIENFNELKEMITEALAQRDATQDQLEGKLARREVNELWAAGIAQIVALPITAVLVFINNPWLDVSSGSSLLIAYVAVFMVAYFAVKQVLSRTN